MELEPDLVYSSGHCSHRFRCLLCSNMEVFADGAIPNIHLDHPKQLLISDEQLLRRFGSKADELEYSEINIFSCPYCDRQRLSIASLYDHLTLEHLDVPLSVRCPVCVCFGRDNALIPDDVHLSKHLADEHSVTMEQYHEHILVYDTYCDDEKDLLKFIACTLPPTYYAGPGTSASPQTPLMAKATTTMTKSSPSSVTTSSSSESKTLGRSCSICLDLVFEVSCRELPCKHKFHSECIELWLQQSQTCPVCRKVVV